MKSPLRYPGGKSRAISKLQAIVDKYYGEPQYLLSPFCGGCSFEFSLSNLKHAILCDKFKPLIIFWNEVKNNIEELIEILYEELKSGIEKEDFVKYRKELIELYANDNDKNYDYYNNLLIAVYFFIINRCSFSGSTLSGGFSKESAKKRFTKNSLANIIWLNNPKSNTKFIQKYEFECKDFKETLINPPENYFIFCDPPYYLHDSKLYGNNGDLHESFNHLEFYNHITNCKNDYIICYNDCEFIRELYKDHIILSESWSYGMNENKKSSEIVILSIRNSNLKNKVITKGSIPHIVGSNFETKVKNYIKSLGYIVDEKTGGSSKNPDVVVRINNEYKINIEAKTKIVGVDYKQFKLEFINNKWVYNSSYCYELINKYIPNNLFDNHDIPCNISSIDFNKLKRETGNYKDISVKIDINDLSQILINNSYIAFSDNGFYKITDEDPLNLECPKFTSNNFILRFYVKNHSSSKALKANLSAVCTLRISNNDVSKSNILIT